MQNATGPACTPHARGTEVLKHAVNRLEVVFLFVPLIMVRKYEDGPPVTEMLMVANFHA